MVVGIIDEIERAGADATPVKPSGDEAACSVNGAAKTHSIVLEHAPAEAACGSLLHADFSTRGSPD